MKTKDQVNTDGRAVFYTVLWPSFRKAALECGYSLALHGSMESDMDMIAVPWIEDAQPVEVLVKAMSDCVGNTVWKSHHFKSIEKKPHNRITYTLSIGADWYIDLSIMQLRTPAASIGEDKKDNWDRAKKNLDVRIKVIVDKRMEAAGIHHLMLESHNDYDSYKETRQEFYDSFDDVTLKDVLGFTPTTPPQEPKDKKETNY